MRTHVRCCIAVCIGPSRFYIRLMHKCCYFTGDSNARDRVEPLGAKLVQ